MALTPFDMEGVNRDLLAAGNPAKPDMQSILRRNARDLVLGNAILVSSVDAKELEFGVHMAYSDADGGFDTDPSEDVWFEASSLPIPNERPDLPPDNALRIRVTDVLTEYGFTDIDVKAPDRTPEGIWIGFEAMQPVRLDVTSAQEGRSVSFTLTAAEANDWRSGRLDAHGLSRMAVERVLARPGDTVTLAYGDSLFRPAVMCDGSGRLPEHRVKAGIGHIQRVRRVSFVRPMASIQSIHFSMDSFQSSRGSTCSQLFLLSFQYLMGLLKRIEKGSDFFITSQGILLRVSGRCSSENQLQGEHAR